MQSTVQCMRFLLSPFQVSNFLISISHIWVDKVVAKAKELNEAPDAYYCMELLSATGIVVVPGSGFGQRDGTFHFRITILPPEDKIQNVVDLLSKFHNEFLSKHK